MPRKSTGQSSGLGRQWPNGSLPDDEVARRRTETSAFADAYAAERDAEHARSRARERLADFKAREQERMVVRGELANRDGRSDEEVLALQRRASELDELLARGPRTFERLKDDVSAASEALADARRRRKSHKRAIERRRAQWDERHIADLAAREARERRSFYRRPVPLGWAVVVVTSIAVVAYLVGNSHLFNEHARWNRDRSDLESSLTIEYDSAISGLDTEDQRATFVDCAGREDDYDCYVFRWSGPKSREAIARAEAAGDPSADTSLFEGGTYHVRLRGSYWTATLDSDGGGGFIERLEGQLIR